MIGISFGEILFIIIVACIFIKPSEISDFVYKYSEAIFKFRQKFNFSIDKIKQDIAISNYNKNTLHDIYGDIIQEPKCPSDEKPFFLDNVDENLIEFQDTEIDDSVPQIPKEEKLDDNYDLFFDHLSKQQDAQNEQSLLELTYQDLKKKINSNN